jgi:hypothetical protein
METSNLISKLFLIGTKNSVSSYQSNELEYEVLKYETERLFYLVKRIRVSKCKMPEKNAFISLLPTLTAFNKYKTLNGLPRFLNRTYI